ncbi:hypothetical protein DYH10_04300 [Candidatus Saccharibacteria bacterium CPR2]|nr:hypothetical protein [Candidatus Saccharibacteria bacterium CPR2]
MSKHIKQKGYKYKMKKFLSNKIGKANKLNRLTLVVFAFSLGIVGYFILRSSAAAPAKWDLNQDRIVNVFDLSMLLSKWNGNDQTADINNDNSVNIFDLSILLAHWGETTSATDASISLVGLVNNQTISGDITLEAIPENAQNVEKFDFYIDNNLINSQSGAPYCMVGDEGQGCFPYDTKQLSNGAHTVKVTLYYSGTSMDKIITINVNNQDGGGDPPPADGWPDATNTGYKHTGVTLKTLTTSNLPAGTYINGKNLFITQPMTLEGYDVAYRVIVQSANVTIKNSRIRTSGDENSPNLQVGSPSSPALQNVNIGDVEIDCTGATKAYAVIGISGKGYIADRLHIHGCGDAIRLEDSATIKNSYAVTDSYVEGEHNDVVQVYSPSGANNMHLYRNRLENGTSNRVILFTDENPTASTNIKVEENLLVGNGQAGNVIIVQANWASTFVNNRFWNLQNSTYVYKAYNYGSYSGNVDHVSGSNIDSELRSCTAGC